eukprot:170197-Hanusia_phi.AAC.1
MGQERAACADQVSTATRLVPPQIISCLPSLPSPSPPLPIISFRSSPSHTFPLFQGAGRAA